MWGTLAAIGAQAGLSGLSNYFGAKSEEDRWKEQLKAQLELEKIRNRLPPEIYAKLMKQLTMPLGAHGGGGGAGGPSVGNFKNFMSMGQQMGAPQPQRKPTDLKGFLGGGGR